MSAGAVSQALFANSPLDKLDGLSNIGIVILSNEEVSIGAEPSRCHRHGTSGLASPVGKRALDTAADHRLALSRRRAGSFYDRAKTAGTPGKKGTRQARL